MRRPPLTMRLLRRAALLATLSAAAASVPQAQAQRHDRPNIIVILADDMGYSDLGSYGSEIPTPHLDRLAREGMRFTRFYNTGRCVPTRAALITGLYPHQVGLGHMTGDDGHPSYRGTLSRSAPTIAETLRGAGYRTYVSGKWHLGSALNAWPLQRGFDRFYGMPDGGGVYFADWLESRGRRLVLDSTVIHAPDDWYSTDAFTEYAVRFVREGHRSGKPFFLYLPHIAPHWPLHAHPADIARHRGRYSAGWDAVRAARLQRQKALGIAEPGWPLIPRDSAVPAWESVADRQEWDLRMAVYAAMVETMDRGVGRLLATLDSLGIADNTLVLFLSDNGASAEQVDRGEPGAPAGDRRSFVGYDRPWAQVGNTPFRFYKSWVHQGGIATPLIARWPDRVPGGAVSRQVGHVIDLVPTLLAAAGARRDPAAPALPGMDLLPTLSGLAGAAPRTLFWEHEGNRAVRVADWKLVAEEGRPWELYDLASDPLELRDLAGSRPQRVAELRGAYARWAEGAGVLPWTEIQRRRRASERSGGEP